MSMVSTALSEPTQRAATELARESVRDSTAGDINIPAAAGTGCCRTTARDYSMSSVSAASEAPPAWTVIPQEVASGSIWSA